LSILRKGDERR